MVEQPLSRIQRAVDHRMVQGRQVLCPSPLVHKHVGEVIQAVLWYGRESAAPSLPEGEPGCLFVQGAWRVGDEGSAFVGVCVCVCVRAM